jgi:intracellular multiplication protein IcmL
LEKNDAQAMIFLRNAFYRRLHYFALSAFLLSLVVIAVLAWVVMYLVENPTPPLYFATDNVGRLIEIIPVDRPNMPTEEVIDWVVEAVEASYTYDFVNYRQQLQGVQRYFTTYGWTRYREALRASNNIIGLTQRKMIFTASVIERPKVIAQGLLGGAYAWKMQMPLLVTYMLPPYDDQAKFSNPLMVTVVVQRQSVLEGYKGLGLVQLIGAMSVSSLNAAPTQISTTPK